MPDSYRIFTLEEANGLLPWLNYQFGMIMAHLHGMEKAIATLMHLGLDPSPVMMKEKNSDSHLARKAKRKLRKTLAEIFRYYSDVKNAGVIVQDISRGIVSFYTHFGEHPVFLSWQYGENEIRWWHEIYEDTDSRKPLPRCQEFTGLQN